MSTYVQNNPIVFETDIGDPTPGPFSSTGIFCHTNGTDNLFLTEYILVDGHYVINLAQIGGVAFGDLLVPPSDLNRTLYHPNGTNRLYVRQLDGTWVNIAGLQPGSPNVVMIYVNSVTGSDTTGTGFPENPFQTFSFAYSQLPKDPSGICRIILEGEGPYELPNTLNAVTPQGPAGQPLLICGDNAMVVVATGTVSAADGPYIEFGTSIAVDAWRGLIYRGLTGSSALIDYQIANNTATRAFSIGGTFDAAPGDTFQIVRPLTQLNVGGDGNLRIQGPGKIGFWHCTISYNACDVISASALFDGCILFAPDVFSGRLQADCQFMSTHRSKDFAIILDAGTQSGSVGAYFQTLEVEAGNGIRMFDGSFGSGYIISRAGLDTWTAGRWQLFGTDIDLTNSVNSFGIVCKADGYLELNTGYHRIKAGGAGGVGVRLQQGAVALISITALDITDAGLAAMIVESGAMVHMDGVIGTTGNGYGVLVRNGGILFNNGSNTVSGSLGPVLIEPSNVALLWADVGPMSVSYSKGFNTKRTPVENVNYTAKVTDQLIAYTTLTATRSVTLPLPAATGATAEYIFRQTVKDESGNASPSVTIVISTGVGHGPNTIEAPYGIRSYYTDGTAWYFDTSPDAP